MHTRRVLRDKISPYLPISMAMGAIYSSHTNARCSSQLRLQRHVVITNCCLPQTDHRLDHRHYIFVCRHDTLWRDLCVQYISNQKYYVLH